MDCARADAVQVWLKNILFIAILRAIRCYYAADSAC